MTRLTNAFSKKWENLEAAYNLWFAHYNFCRIHKTLGMTPAMEAGVCDTAWSIGDLLAAGFDSGKLRVVRFFVMATYILIALGAAQAVVDTAVESSIPSEDRLSLESGKWLLTSSLPTSKEVSDKLGLSVNTTFIICPIRGYYGRTNPNVWEWLAAKSSPALPPKV